MQNNFNTLENHLTHSHQDAKGSSLNFLPLPSNITSEFFRNLLISDVGIPFFLSGSGILHLEEVFHEKLKLEKQYYMLRENKAGSQDSFLI